jgi:hypothetical protein
MRSFPEQENKDKKRGVPKLLLLFSFHRSTVGWLQVATFPRARSKRWLTGYYQVNVVVFLFYFSFLLH